MPIDGKTTVTDLRILRRVGQYGRLIIPDDWRKLLGIESGTMVTLSFDMDRGTVLIEKADLEQEIAVA